MNVHVKQAEGLIGKSVRVRGATGKVWRGRLLGIVRSPSLVVVDETGTRTSLAMEALESIEELPRA